MADDLQRCHEMVPETVSRGQSADGRALSKREALSRLECVYDSVRLTERRLWRARGPLPAALPGNSARTGQACQPCEGVAVGPHVQSLPRVGPKEWRMACSMELRPCSCAPFSCARPSRQASSCGASVCLAQVAQGRNLLSCSSACLTCVNARHVRLWWFDKGKSEKADDGAAATCAGLHVVQVLGGYGIERYTAKEGEALDPTRHDVDISVTPRPGAAREVPGSVAVTLKARALPL